jgi:hypothetical protein
MDNATSTNYHFHQTRSPNTRRYAATVSPLYAKYKPVQQQALLTTTILFDDFDSSLILFTIFRAFLDLLPLNALVLFFYIYVFSKCRRCGIIYIDDAALYY